MLLVASAAAIAAVALRQRQPADVPALHPFDGWSLRGARHVEYGDDGVPVLSVAVGEARLERLRFGIFRLGFAHRLDARDVEITTTLSATGGGDLSRRFPDLQKSLTALGMPPSRRAGLTSVRIDGLRLRVDGASGEWLEILAQRCGVGFPRARRVELRNGVRIRGVGVDRTFGALSYDLATRRFVGGQTATASGNVSSSDLRRALEEVNRALTRLLPAVSGTP